MKQEHAYLSIKSMSVDPFSLLNSAVKVVLIFFAYLMTPLYLWRSPPAIIADARLRERQNRGRRRPEWRQVVLGEIILRADIVN